MMQQIRFTQAGYKKLEIERDELLKNRPSVVEDLRKAREMGDLSENGYYKASRAKLSSVDRRLRIIFSTIKQAIIVGTKHSHSDLVSIGSTVTLSYGKKERSYTVVGDLEADPSEGKISLLSPLGKVIEGKRISDVVDLNTPTGKITYKIIAVT